MEEDDRPSKPRKKQVSISEEVPVSDGRRPTRRRVPTSFVKAAINDWHDDGDDDEESDDDNDENDEKQPKRSSIRGSMSEHKERTESLVRFDPATDAQDEKRPTRIRLPTSYVRKSTVSSLPDDESSGGEEAESDAELKQVADPHLEKHRVRNAEKDRNFLKKAMSEINVFADFEDDMFTALIDVMELFSFKDGDELIREGAKDGTHFFIASEGTFDVVVKGDVRAQIHSGMGFGESVFLESGVRRATVRAKGRAQAFGMRGHMVRKVLKRRHWQKHGEVVAPISEILSSDDCVLLRRLTPFQVQKLYDVALLRHLKDGELLYSGTTHDNDVYVVLSGALILPREGAPRRIERFGVVGVMSAILGCRAGAGKLYSEGMGRKTGGFFFFL